MIVSVSEPALHVYTSPWDTNNLEKVRVRWWVVPPLSVVTSPRDTPSGEPVLTTTSPFFHTISAAVEVQVRVYALPAMKELSSTSVVISVVHKQRSRGIEKGEKEKGGEMSVYSPLRRIILYEIFT